MSANQRRLSGGCGCGAVRFEAVRPPLWIAHCHCRDCRRATAAALSTYAGFRRSRVRWTAGAPATYESSPGVARRFCGHCGTPLSYQGARWPDEVHLFVCAFDDPAAFAPQAHVYAAEQLPWLHLADSLPRHPGTAGPDDEAG